eukprot:CAMPEP_0172567344 /NCGR_PEP_ID=MMETSP1067-20121228/115580_1 /TAXON_ID=265564 ORGANISM="Thalassiosira punctigera, Strain Tpunct2005C2" /NCGR_SAMPLE_ID=MMETSP1067 /ASSEMBLY_ACC=CAM_ASM_000444 /LENGTH=99 /DNA_ID=CAMNT_0013358683 /DNA_START=42 /DNA_END=336 /DNA_ORIENTATION=+
MAHTKQETPTASRIKAISLSILAAALVASLFPGCEDGDVTGLDYSPPRLSHSENKTNAFSTFFGGHRQAKSLKASKSSSGSRSSESSEASESYESSKSS